MLQVMPSLVHRSVRRKREKEKLETFSTDSVERHYLEKLLKLFELELTFNFRKEEQKISHTLF